MTKDEREKKDILLVNRIEMNELELAINNFKAGKISDEELISKLLDIKEKIPTDLK